MTDSNPLVVELSATLACDLELLGGKAASLTRLKGMGLPVPPAFVVTTIAFDHFLAHNRLSSSNDISPDAVLAGTWPEELANRVSRQLGSLAGERFAIRSSAIAEDGTRHSLAGQLKTCLGVERNRALDEIKHCWSSLFLPQTQAYWQRLPNARRRMAVVVQELVEPNWSGVAFSLDPRSNDCDHIIIEWTRGLGDRLVSGQVTPERVTLSRRHHATTTGGDPHLRAHLETVRQLTLRVEREFQVPVDVEWCATDTALWLLQARPITAIDHSDYVLWSNVNLVENFPEALAPLACSMLNRFYQDYMRSTLRLVGWSETEFASVAHLLSALTGIQGGRIYYNLSSWYRLVSYFPWAADLQKFLNTYIGQDVPIRVPPDDTAPQLRARQQAPLGVARFVASLGAAFMETQRALTTLDRQLSVERRLWRNEAAHTTDPRMLLALLDRVRTFVLIRWRGPCSADLMVMIFPGLLATLIERWCARTPNDVLPRLLQGISAKSEEPARRLWRLSQSIADSPVARARLSNCDYQVSSELMSLAQRDEFAEFLRDFGGRCYKDCSLTSPTFEEQPALAWTLVQRYAEVPDPFAPAVKSRLRADRDALLRELCHELPRWQSVSLRAVVKASVRALEYREHGRLQQSLLFGEMRYVARHLGALLSERGTFGDPDDVFWLTYEELEGLVQGRLPYPETYRALIDSRKTQRVWANADMPPSVFMMRSGETWRGTGSKRERADEAFDDKVLTGTTVSRGRVRGKARVIRDPIANAGISHGEILVAPSTDPGWTPLFVLAKGLILETGGVLSHGAIIARELGIPALAAVRNACSRIVDGTLLDLDADAGRVTFV